MHLTEILELRGQPLAGLFLALTRRCPLHCSHCSTNSTLESEQAHESVFTNMVGSFTVDERPALILMSGGEPMLRPDLVARLARSAHAVGAKAAAITGAFFAARKAIPPTIDEAIRSLDHLIVSIDIFHELEVPRSDVFRLLQTLLDRGQQVSVQTVGSGPDDPYVAELTEAVRAAFADRVPVLVGELGPSGRPGEDIGVADTGRRDGEVMVTEAEACTFASWPVVGYSGTVVACCQQAAIDNTPPHLALGHGATSTWRDVIEASRVNPVVRALRVYGPRFLQTKSEGSTCNGYCESCLAIGDGATEVAVALTSTKGFTFTEQLVAEANRNNGMRGISERYASLVELGRREPAVSR